MLLASCSRSGQHFDSKNGFAVLHPAAPGESVATFAGGCFWSMQESMIELKGVHRAVCGYTGGTAPDPTYEEVAAGQTGHAEAVQVYYNPDSISYCELARVFFTAHNPTELNRQGPDVGPEYRSAVYYRNALELNVLEKIKSEMENNKSYPKEVVTSFEPFHVFYPAEVSQQNYYPKNSLDPYIRGVSRPKVMHVRQEFPRLIKTGLDR